MSDDNVVPTVEDQAKDMGWKPLEEYEGDKTKWVNAEIFVARAPLFEKIDADKKAHRRELEEMKRAMRELSEHNKRVAEASYKQALEDLKSQKQEAIAEGDATKALLIADKIDTLKENKPAVPEPQQNQIAPIIFQEWVEENSWYATDAELKEEADTIGTALALKGLSPEAVLEKVSEKIKKMFPEKFGTKKVVAPPSGEGASKGASASRKDSFQLSEEETRAMKKFVSLGVITEEKYKEDLRKIKGL